MSIGSTTTSTRGTLLPHEHARNWRARHPGADKRRRSGNRHKSPRLSHRPFIGCDGEGGGTDQFGRQNYLLLSLGDHTLFTGKPLTTLECLEHIASVPNKGILVGFSFGYDVTMILKDLPAERRERLLQPHEIGPGKSRFTWFGDFGIEYLPRQYFRVCRIQNGKTVPKSSRTIYETFGFFQMSFARALKAFGVGLDKLPEIQAMKEARADFETMTDEVIRYNQLECQFLAEMMEKLRNDCHAAGMRPRTWNGAGKLAACLHQSHDTMRREAVETLVPAPVLDYARRAYYGGRFETTRAGRVAGPVHEYDIRSAYPAAMRELPCLEHGTWERVTEEPASGLWVGSVSFTHPNETFLCGLPIRRKGGHIFWPREGRGVYWSVEIEAARRLGCETVFRDGWRYVPGACACNGFRWVQGLYDYRRSLGSSGEGYSIKLGINSLYGKLAQRVGNPVFGNPVYAGLITAITRARLMEAAAHDPGAVVMLATDAVYSTRPLPLDVGSGLGQWEEATHQRLFIVQPGLYWGPPPEEWTPERLAAWKHKTRGLSPRFFETRWRAFEEAWEIWRERDTAALRGAWTPPPSVSVPVRNFIGLKLAQARGKPETAGRWVDQERAISFDWTRKRGAYRWDGNCIVTQPQAGAPDLESVFYVADATLHGVWDGAREELEDQPDAVELSTPWSDE